MPGITHLWCPADGYPYSRRHGGGGRTDTTCDVLPYEAVTRLATATTPIKLGNIWILRLVSRRHSDIWVSYHLGVVASEPSVTPTSILTAPRLKNILESASGSQSVWTRHCRPINPVDLPNNLQREVPIVSIPQALLQMQTLTYLRSSRCPKTGYGCAPPYIYPVSI